MANVTRELNFKMDLILPNLNSHLNPYMWLGAAVLDNAAPDRVSGYILACGFQ